MPSGRRMSRRGFIAAGSASLLSTGLSACCHLRPSQLKFAALPPAMFPSLAGRLAIDAHCHMFNGTDLQVRKFIQWNPDIPVSEPLRGIVGEIVQALTWNFAPTGCDEYKVLGEIAAGTRPAPSDAATLEPYREKGYKGFQKEMRKTPAYQEGKSAEHLLAADTRSQYLKAIRVLVDAGSNREHRQLLAQPLGTANDLELRSVMSFLAHGFHYRFVNVLDYLETYNPQGYTGRSLDLLIANMVDYDWPLDEGGGTKTSFQDQIAVMERLSIFTKGRVHAMVPFDPMRAVAEAAGKPPAKHGRHLPFADLTDAVLQRGCVGIKLYPVMGFKPTRNAAMDPAKTWSQPFQPAWMSKPITIGGHTESFGYWLDKHLDELYTWCSANEVPITVHADNTQGPAGKGPNAKSLYDMFPFDEAWADVFDRYKDLKVNFGHFGSPTGSVVNGQLQTSDLYTWLLPFTVGPKAGSHTYGDMSYPGGAIAQPASAAQSLRAMFQAAGNGTVTADLHDRVMYGTDWLMLLLAQNSSDTLKVMESVFANLDGTQHGGPTYADRFFALNAIEWLGLRTNQKARVRLEQFYAKNGMTGTNSPPWIAKVDALPTR